MTIDSIEAALKSIDTQLLYGATVEFDEHDDRATIETIRKALTYFKTLRDVDVEGLIQDIWAEFDCDLSDEECAIIRRTTEFIISQGYLTRPVWQPIETAPKDGTGVLTTQGNYPEDLFCDRWDVKHQRWGYDAKPTHWMPLPPPPTAGEE